VQGVLRALLKVIEGARSVEKPVAVDTPWHP
jgi:hypothetical protein